MLRILCLLIIATSSASSAVWHKDRNELGVLLR